MLNGGKFLNCSSKQNDSSIFETTVNVSCPNNITYQPTPICILPPFLFLVTNASELNDTLNCTKNCYLSQCWNVTAFKMAVIMRIPTHVPIPVSIPDDKLPEVLSRKKRDFACHCCPKIANRELKPSGEEISHETITEHLPYLKFPCGKAYLCIMYLLCGCSCWDISDFPRS
uniref:Uncharacterized protein n=1 Tax=Neovison vison TaxID=452646 RepID=A0A8C7AJP9_NEOVI